MNYTIKVNRLKETKGSLEGFAQVVFGNAFKVTNIAILRNQETNQLFVSMPRYKSKEDGTEVYKDICNPITKEFREELYQGILVEFSKLTKENWQRTQQCGKEEISPQFTVKAALYEREGSNLKGLARIYLEEQFVINNISILQGNDNVFVSMPSYKTNQKDGEGKDKYQDLAYPITREFRKELYDEILQEYERERERSIETERVR